MTDAPVKAERITDLAFMERLIAELDHNIGVQLVAQKELINERDRLYTSQFKAAEVAVSAALAAAEKAVNAAFTASEKAVLKAEQAQKEYNERSNEFRGQLDDQAKTLMPRPETLNMFKALEEKITGVSNVTEARFVAASVANHNEWTAMHEALEKASAQWDTQIQSLRESRSGNAGRDSAVSDARDQHNWSLGIIALVGLSLAGMVVSIGIAIFSLYHH
jgi:hypothetical protein